MINKTVKVKRRIRRIPVPQRPPKIEPGKKVYNRSKENNILRKNGIKV
jgi:hypothetical protein